MDEWKDIASAPKDGTRFLAVWGKYEIQLTHWHSWPDELQYRIKAGGTWVADDRVAMNAQPTLWMPMPPLPEPPKGEQE